jgi:hypothetical protein
MVLVDVGGCGVDFLVSHQNFFTCLQRAFTSDLLSLTWCCDNIAAWWYSMRQRREA